MILMTIIIICGILLFILALSYVGYYCWKKYVAKKQTKNESKLKLVISLSLIGHILIIVISLLLSSLAPDLLLPTEKFSLDGESFVDIGLLEEPSAAAAETEPEKTEPVEPEETKPEEETIVTKQNSEPLPTVSTSTPEPSKSTASSEPQTNNNPDNTSSSNTSTQNNNSTTGGGGDSKEKALQIAEEMPLFPGCETEHTPIAREECTRRKMTEYIQKTVKYPDLAIKNNINGEVKVTFVIEKDGSISELKVVGDKIGHGCAEAAITAIKTMNNFSKKIQNGRQNGRAVRIRYTIPVKFNLKELKK